LANCLQDAAASLNWLQNGAICEKFRIDPQRIVIVGHSMGGFVALHTAAERREVMGAALISPVDLGQAFGGGDKENAATAVDRNVGVSAGLHILAGTSPRLLAQEARHNAHTWRLAAYAPQLAERPLLTVTSDDGFAAGGDALADAVQIRGGRLTHVHMATDHSYSNCRIELQTKLLQWLSLMTCLD
jgi:pimeloyl-ACP methyl ester carboxylesterase